MGSFVDRFTGCMTGKNLPAPVLQSAKEVLALVGQVGSALRVLGLNPQVSLGELVAAALARGLITEAVGATILGAGEAAADILVAAFIAACVGCLVSTVELADLRALSAANDIDPLARDQLAQLGVDLGDAEDQSAVG